MEIKSQKHIRIDSHLLSKAEGFPNNPKLALLVYRQALGETGNGVAGDVERLFESHGWGGTWRNGVYDYHHFHSNTHEALGVCAGRAKVQFGGPTGPIIAVEAGDVAILPAGTGHKRVEASQDFLVVGAYPAGHEQYDLLRGDPKEQQAAEQRVAKVPVPDSDPVYGAEGPLFGHWSSTRD